MLHGLFIVSLIGAAMQSIKNACMKTIPAANWANKELQFQDRMNGMSELEIIKNAEKGRYLVIEEYPEPHHNERGQIMIENHQLWIEDLNKYGSVQTDKWAKQGKYNLDSESLKKEQERIEKHFEELMKLKVK